MLVNLLIRSMRFLLRFGCSWLIISVLNYTGMGFVPIATLWLSKQLINSIATLIHDQSAQSYQTTLLYLLLQFGIFILNSAFQNVQMYFNRKLTLKLDGELQIELFQKVVEVPLAYFDLPEFYNRVNRVNNTLGQRFITPITQLLELFKETISLISIVIFLFSIHWSLVVLSIVTAVPAYLLQVYFSNKQFGLHLYQTQPVREMNYIGNLLNMRDYAKEIRIFRLGSFLIGRWRGLFEKNQTEFLKVFRKQQGSTIWIESFSAIVYIVSAFLIIRLIKFSKLQIGDFVVISQAIQDTQSSISKIATTLANIYESSLYIQDFYHLLELDLAEFKQPQRESLFPVPLCSGITFRDVSFSYPGLGTPILKGVSFHIQAGEKIAIVGENGSGKSTLIKCIMGLYSVSEGDILFDGVSIRDLKKEELAKHMNVIFQDFVRYNFKLKENIQFGNLDAIEDTERLQDVLEKSNVTEIVNRYPTGLETYLGNVIQEGVDLSGGQWQRIALARALFASGEVMILDEPTSALDPKKEMEVFQHFETMSQGRTTIFISHRMTAASMADRILVMKSGEIVEMGTHNELIALDGEYAEMYRMQAKWFDLQPV